MITMFLTSTSTLLAAAAEPGASALLALDAHTASSTLATCNDTLLHNIGLGAGGTVAQLANVSSLEDCCTLCHTLEHDFCAGWVFGETKSHDVATLYSTFESSPAHNCAIMAKNGEQKPVANHVSAIVHAPSPSPAAPPAPGQSDCRADLDCQPGECRFSNLNSPLSRLSTTASPCWISPCNT